MMQGVSNRQAIQLKQSSTKPKQKRYPHGIYVHTIEDKTTMKYGVQIVLTINKRNAIAVDGED